MNIFLRGREEGDRLGFLIGSMNSAEALIKSIQGLSATPGDLSALHGILKKAEDSLRNNWDVQLATLEELDPSIHSLGYLYLL